MIAAGPSSTVLAGWVRANTACDRLSDLDPAIREPVEQLSESEIGVGRVADLNRAPGNLEQHYPLGLVDTLLSLSVIVDQAPAGRTGDPRRHPGANRVLAVGQNSG